MLGFFTARAQNTDFARVDSMTNALYQYGDWRQLIHVAKNAVDSGVDYPALRARLGYAYMMSGNYSAALQQFGQVFKGDSYNQEARYNAYLCHLYLNELQGASYNASYLDTFKLAQRQTSKYSLLFAGAESGIKYTDDAYRDNALYTRIFLTNRLSWKLQLDQSASYFGQMLHTLYDDGRQYSSIYDSQWEYYGKLSFAASDRIVLFGIYHYLNTKYQNITYNSHIGTIGLKYAASYVDLQADANLGNMLGHAMSQYNGQVMIYPNGNLNLYAISRASLVSQLGTSNVVYSQGLGFKLFRHFWAETMAVFGKLDNYAENDGLYIYNSVDLTSFKIGETGMDRYGPMAARGLISLICIQRNFAKFGKHQKKIDQA
jgi:hypothetical protein